MRSKLNPRTAVRTVFFLTMVAFLTAATAFGQDLRREGRWYVQEIRKSYKVDAAGSLEMRELNGDISVSAWPKNEVEIVENLRLDVFTEEEANRVLQACEESYSQTGSRVVVDGRGRPRRATESHFTVSVPAGFTLDLSTSGGDVSVHQVKGNTTLRTSGGDISLTETGGTVRASTSGGDVSVRDAAGMVTVKTSGGDLELERIKGVLEAKTSGGNIMLRSADKTVDLATSGGDVEIYDVAGDVVARTSGGDVQVENTKGSVSVATSGGDIVLREIHGRLEGSTSGGDIRAERLHSATRLRTSGGDIRVRELMAGLEASTSGGSVEVEMTLADFSKPHAMTLSSSGGDIEVFLPAKLPARIFAEIQLEGRWGFGERYDLSSDFPIKIERGDGEGRGGRYIRGEGDINGGGDLISLKTSAGNIMIRKSATK